MNSEDGNPLESTTFEQALIERFTEIERRRVEVIGRDSEGTVITHRWITGERLSIINPSVIESTLSYLEKPIGNLNDQDTQRLFLLLNRWWFNSKEVKTVKYGEVPLESRLSDHYHDFLEPAEIQQLDVTSGQRSDNPDLYTNMYLAFGLASQQLRNPNTNNSFKSLEEVEAYAQTLGIKIDAGSLKTALNLIVYEKVISHLENLGLISNRDTLFRNVANWISEAALRQQETLKARKIARPIYYLIVEGVDVHRDFLPHAMHAYMQFLISLHFHLPHYASIAPSQIYGQELPELMRYIDYCLRNVDEEEGERIIASVNAYKDDVVSLSRFHGKYPQLLSPANKPDKVPDPNSYEIPDLVKSDRERLYWVSRYMPFAAGDRGPIG